MLQNDDLVGAVSICIHSVENLRSSLGKDSTWLTIRTQLDDKTFISKPKRADRPYWDDYLVYNLKDLHSDDLEIDLLSNGESIGSAPLGYRRIRR